MANLVDQALSTPAPQASQPAPPTNLVDQAMTPPGIGFGRQTKSATGGAPSPIGGGWLELLNRPNEAMLAHHASGNWHDALQTFLHSESAQKYQADTENALSDWYKSTTGGAQTGPSDNVNRFLGDVLMQTIYDPTILLGKLGAGERLLESVEAKGLPTAMTLANTFAKKAIEKVRGGREFIGPVNPKFIGPINATMGNDAKAAALEKLFTWVGRGGKALHWLAGVDSKNKQDLAREFGADWLPIYKMASSLRGQGENLREMVSHAFLNEFKNALVDLTDKEKLTVVRAVNGGKIQLLPEAYRAYGQHVKDIFDAMHYLGRTKDVELMMKKFGYALPGFASKFDVGRLGTRTTKTFLEHYFPSLHDFGDIADQTAAERESLKWHAKARQAFMNPLNIQNPFLEHRYSPMNIQGTRISPPITSWEDALHRATTSFSAFGKEYQGAFVKRGLRDRFAPYAAARAARQGAQRTIWGPGTEKAAAKLQALGRTSGRAKYSDVPLALKGTDKTGAGGMMARAFLPTDKESDIESTGSGFKKFTDFRKSAMFFTQYPHMANITMLLGLASPTAVPKAYALYMKLRKMTPEQRLAELRDVIDAGALSLRNVDRQSSFIEAISSKAAPLGAQYRKASDLLWTFDDAAKAALFREYRKAGKSAEDAAYEVNAQLVDYAHRSPGAEYARTAVPFATWRSKMPMAVARSIAKHPEIPLTAARTSPIFGGAQVQAQGPYGQPGTASNYGPLAEVNKMTGPGGIMDYLRASAGPEVKTLASMLGVSREGYKGKNYATYGVNPLEFEAWSSIPGVAELLDIIGLGPLSSKTWKGKSGLNKALQPLLQILQQSTRTYTH